MSTIIMSQCWPLQGLSVTQKAVLISLADQANDDGVCWPAVGTIAARCCMSPRAVRTAMDHLEAVGLLTRDRRFNSSTVYNVTPAKFDKEVAPSRAPARLVNRVLHRAQVLRPMQGVRPVQVGMCPPQEGMHRAQVWRCAPCRLTVI
ncbi:helix-turn-helix domain-containing protein [Stenotrophomonas sp.]|uniref:helix-turn-helix domain-containing protein n=1 Tax=Stenotrophomonas sp. TaxID=69392 RepID=UPI0028972DAA|nr:helix-turn-helix domain-containing protein [Stenotrophomonas sp.]